ncbi:acetylxylan esterase [Chitinophaga lutea]|uniref:Acetylxylan esterase n=1 Tax=Chitinophaga lutea TaxID=2488634 RepID=A0A3N4PMU6_9BACT|nr:acetylxylan esterase [Chitinophaga lutea]RPE07959.1 acetylxylan esterase [Chitinophaga lutea]
MSKFNRLFLFLVLSCSTAWAQPVEQLIKVIVAPDHTDWIYRIGEKAKFTVTVLENGNPVKDAKISYEVGPEKLKPAVQQTAVLKDGTLVIDGGTMQTPGFLRCAVTAEVKGKTYRRLATAGFNPTAIQPTVTMPADFSAFWNKGKSELAKVPLDARSTLLPERCTENVNVYHVNIQGYGNSRLYGILCVPKKEGKYPAVLRVPGAGIRPYGGDIARAELGFITLEIGIHGIPVNLDPSVYTSLAAGALNGYPSFNIDDKDRYYYKRVYLNCVRANDFLVSLPQFDGANLGVMGGSQGGALSIVTASLDSRVKYLAAMYPALSDVTGYTKGRAGGWPHLFRGDMVSKEALETAGYYDVVNFAKQLKQPGYYTWGYNDETCPPTSMYAVYNSITAPKDLYLLLETGHYVYPEQVEVLGGWLTKQLKK